MALCDLGATINLMPSSMYRKLGVGKSHAYICDFANDSL